MIYIVGKLWISRFMSSRPHTPEFNLYAVRFFVTLRESSHHRTSHSVLTNDVDDVDVNGVDGVEDAHLLEPALHRRGCRQT